MKRGSIWSKWVPVVLAAATFSMWGFVAGGLQGSTESQEVRRPDVITIDGLKQFGALERPAVYFLHDKHTAFMEEQKKNCSTCHPAEAEKLSPKFMRLQDVSREAVMDIYHTQCITCHQQNQTKAEKSGPTACGQCHMEKSSVTSSRKPMEMDKWLHARHSGAMEKKCERCHHEYDAKAKKLFYAKEQEGSCRYCHKAVTEENRISMRLASHAACIDCHRKRTATALSAGPVQCAGCHDPAVQTAFEKVEPLPRMERKQPDVVFVNKGELKETADGVDIRMNPVPFDHKAHEGYNASCRVCHHADLKSCSTCHSVEGTKEGKGIQLARAMHAMGNDSSCMGCHESRKTDKNCSGCHAFIAKTREPDRETCTLCHMAPSQPLKNPYGGAENQETARKMLEARPTVAETFEMADIPEKVVIKTLSKQYEPVELPHRKIVATLVNTLREKPLARYFHREKGTVCQGCHHNSPAAVKPPACGSCHGNPFEPGHLMKPGLMAAYHQQCMGCHQKMGIEKPSATDCSACHIEKKRWLTSGS